MGWSRAERCWWYLGDLEGKLPPPLEHYAILIGTSSGCSTLLKTISGETHGFFVDEASEINYQGTFLSAML